LLGECVEIGKDENIREKKSPFDDKKRTVFLAEESI
jgi:hypothetical protein